MEKSNPTVSDDKTTWHKNNNLHRIDGPAVEWADGYKEFREYGQLIEKFS